MDAFTSVLTLAFLGSIAGLLGDLVFVIKKSWARSLTTYAIPLAAGVLLAVSFLDLLPEAFEFAGSDAFGIVLAVYVILFLIEQLFVHLHHHDEKKERMRGSVAFVIFGDSIHNFLDGVAIAASYAVNPAAGVAVGLATFFHEVPHEIVDFGILLSAGWSTKKALLANLLSALFTFLGAIIAFVVTNQIKSVTGILVSVAAGLFLYVATTDFLPQLRQKGKQTKFIAWFLFGIFIIVALTRLMPEMG